MIKHKDKIDLDFEPHLFCRRGGIGRHDRLKICCPQRRVGSTPTGGTCITFIFYY